MLGFFVRFFANSGGKKTLKSCPPKTQNLGGKINILCDFFKRFNNKNLKNTFSHKKLKTSS